MHQLGIVDAVWSDDGDTLMFGATCVFSAHKVGKNWSTDEIRVVHAATILAEHDLDSSSMVLFAMLAGGDYNTAGLPNCGPQIARVVAKKGNGLADALCRSSAQDLPSWRLRLEDVLQQAGKRVPVPSTFPDQKVLGHYREPKVTSDDGLRNLTCLKQGWDLKIDENKLRVLLRQRFNIWTKGYLKHFAPVFMIRQLARCPPHDEAMIGNTKFDIEVKKTRQKKAGVGEASVDPVELEKKVTFYPLPAVDIDIHEPRAKAAPNAAQDLRSELPLRRNPLQLHARRRTGARRLDQSESMQLLDLHKVRYVQSGMPGVPLCLPSYG